MWPQVKPMRGWDSAQRVSMCNGNGIFERSWFYVC